MKILIASTPATGHLNPLLAIGRILIAEGHKVIGLSGSAFRGHRHLVESKTYLCTRHLPCANKAR